MKLLRLIQILILVKKVKAKFLNKPLFVIESSTAIKYLKYTKQEQIFNVSKYGISADSAGIKEYYGMGVKTLVEKIKKIVNKI